MSVVPSSFTLGLLGPSLSSIFPSCGEIQGYPVATILSSLAFSNSHRRRRLPAVMVLVYESKTLVPISQWKRYYMATVWRTEQQWLLQDGEDLVFDFYILLSTQ